MSILRNALLLMLGAGCAHSAATPSHDSTAPAPAPAAPAGPAEANVVDEGLVLPPVRHAVGERYTFVDDFSIKSRIEPSAVESIRYDRNQDRETTIEVLEVDAQGKATRERITYAIDEIRSILNRKATRDGSPIEGKNYLVTHAADSLTVTDDGGRTPPKAEVDAVRHLERDDGMDDVLERMLAGHRWYADQRVELGAAALEAINRASSDSRSRFTAWAIELRSVDGGVATFAVSVTLDQGTNNGPLLVKLTGTEEVDIATGRKLQSTMRGPVTGTLGGAPVTGEATMSARTK